MLFSLVVIALVSSAVNAAVSLTGVTLSTTPNSLGDTWAVEGTVNATCKARAWIETANGDAKTRIVVGDVQDCTQNTCTVNGLRMPVSGTIGYGMDVWEPTTSPFDIVSVSGSSTTVANSGTCSPSGGTLWSRGAVMNGASETCANERPGLLTEIETASATVASYEEGAQLMEALGQVTKNLHTLDTALRNSQLTKVSNALRNIYDGLLALSSTNLALNGVPCVAFKGKTPITNETTVTPECTCDVVSVAGDLQLSASCATAPLSPGEPGGVPYAVLDNEPWSTTNRAPVLFCGSGSLQGTTLSGTNCWLQTAREHDIFFSRRVSFTHAAANLLSNINEGDWGTEEDPCDALSLILRRTADIVALGADAGADGDANAGASATTSDSAAVSYLGLTMPTAQLTNAQMTIGSVINAAGYSSAVDSENDSPSPRPDYQVGVSWLSTSGQALRNCIEARATAPIFAAPSPIVELGDATKFALFTADATVEYKFQFPTPQGVQLGPPGTPGCGETVNFLDYSCRSAAAKGFSMTPCTGTVNSQISGPDTIVTCTCSFLNPLPDAASIRMMSAVIANSTAEGKCENNPASTVSGTFAAALVAIVVAALL
jgi:hypothetical protein